MWDPNFQIADRKMAKKHQEIIKNSQGINPNKSQNLNFLFLETNSTIQDNYFLPFQGVPTNVYLVWPQGNE